MFAAARVTAELRAGREDLPLDLFQFLTGARHKFNVWRIGNETGKSNFLKRRSASDSRHLNVTINNIFLLTI
jgi:hypothetical protein